MIGYYEFRGKTTMLQLVFYAFSNYSRYSIYKKTFLILTVLSFSVFTNAFILDFNMFI